MPAVIEPEPLEDLSSITLLGYLVKQKHPVVRDWNVGSPTRVELDSLVTYTGRYKSIGSMGLASIFPVVEGYKDYGAVGLRADISDPGFWNSAFLKLSYSPTGALDSNERLHGHL
ncbi:MAG: hypothetical protein GWN29_00530, partial [Gammaproteobacteria bacterium]|nr:hypothetical protein [Gammaproteobacteria bacterium]